MGLFDGCFVTLLGEVYHKSSEAEDEKEKNESFPGPIAFDLCGPRGAGQAIGSLSQNWDSLF